MQSQSVGVAVEDPIMLNGFAGRVRTLGVAALLACATMFAPAAFARGGHHSNWGVSIGFSGPGYSVGYSDCRHCGGGYFSGSVYGGYYPGGYYGGGWSNGYNGGYYSSHYPSSYYRYPSSYYGGYYGSYYSPSYYYQGGPWYGDYYRTTHVRRSYHRERPVVVRRVVRYDDYYDDDRRGRDYDDGSYYPGRDYGDRDRQYLQRASYYDRRD